MREVFYHTRRHFARGSGKKAAAAAPSPFFPPGAGYAGWQGVTAVRVLYLDELLLVNFAAGAAFLLAAGLLAGVRCSGPRLAAGAALAAASCLVLLAPEMGALPALAYKAASGAGAAGLAPGGHAANLTAYLDITPGRLLAGTAAVYIGVRGLLAFLGRPGRAAVPARLELAGGAVDVLAYYDSGFTLADPVSGRGVVLVRYGAVRDALPADCRACLDAVFAGEAPAGPALGLRYLCCGTIAGRTLLPALPAAALNRAAGPRSWRAEGLLAAFCPGDAGEGEGWTLLLGPGLAGQMGL